MEGIVIDGGPRGAVLGAAMPMIEEGAGGGPVWVLCDILLASGDTLLGGIRLSPPLHEYGMPTIVRATGLLACVAGAGVDILSGTERARHGMFANETLPLRIRMAAEPPIPITGLHPDSPDRPLGAGEWSRKLSPIDLAADVQALAPIGFRRRTG